MRVHATAGHPVSLHTLELTRQEDGEVLGADACPRSSSDVAPAAATCRRS